MSYKITLSSVLAILLFAATLALAPIVTAQEVEQKVETSTEVSSSESLYEQKQQKLEEAKAAAEKKREEVKEQAKQKVEAAKLQANAKKLELRKKSCEARASALENKFKATSAAAERHFKKIDDFNDKITTFKDKYQLSPTNYDALLATVAQKASEAEAAVSELSDFDVLVNCDDVDAATQKVLVYKEQLALARDALKSYRAATKDLLVAVRTSAEQKEAERTATDEPNTQTNNDTTTQEGVN